MKSSFGLNETPVYVSKPTGRNFWQKYSVYSDRIELRSWFCFKNFVIPWEELIEIKVCPREVVSDLWREKSLASLLALKLDWSDIFTHVVIRRRSGLLRYIRFTPDDPEKFVEVCRAVCDNTPTIVSY